MLNYEPILFATKLALSLNSEINLNSSFDRKHYFYADQPQGYQITQHYSPFAQHGHMNLFRDIDNIEQEQKRINITQLQIEQDTGKSTYLQDEKITLIDLNRSNVPLIELVTEPDFTELQQVKAFIKKYQNLIRHLHISTGDLETGAMRVDVNVSINEYPRIELKNLPNTSSIIHAIKFEYERQIRIIETGGTIPSMETRGWDANKMETVKLRSKEGIMDYRYMPDPELPNVTLSEDIITNVRETLPILPDTLIHKLMSEPFNLSLKDAKILTIKSNNQNDLYDHESLRNYYLETFTEYKNQVGSTINCKLPTTWIIHELLGDLNKLQIPLLQCEAILTPQLFSEFLLLLHKEKISNTSGKLLLFHILETMKEVSYDKTMELNLNKLIKEFNLELTNNDVGDNELTEICQQILDNLNNDKMIQDIKSGKKPKSIKFIIGQGMRLYQGRIKPQDFERKFKELLNVK